MWRQFFEKHLYFEGAQTGSGGENPPVSFPSPFDRSHELRLCTLYDGIIRVDGPTVTEEPEEFEPRRKVRVNLLLL